MSKPQHDRRHCSICDRAVAAPYVCPHCFADKRRVCTACDRPYADALEMYVFEGSFSGGESFCWLRDPDCRQAAVPRMREVAR